MYKILASLLISLVAIPVFAADKVGVPLPVPKAESPATAGLELPPDQVVNYDEGYVNIQAKCTGTVKWLVVSGNSKIKYLTLPANSIVISIPPQGGQISVFAVGLVNGSLTEFVRTNITITPQTNPSPTPIPGPAPAAGALHVSFIYDKNTVTPQIAKLLNSATLQKAITDRGYWFRPYDIADPKAVASKLDQVARTVNAPCVMIVQSDDGVVRKPTPIAMPLTEQEIINIVNGVK